MAVAWLLKGCTRVYIGLRAKLAECAKGVWGGWEPDCGFYLQHLQPDKRLPNSLCAFKLHFVNICMSVCWKVLFLKDVLLKRGGHLECCWCGSVRFFFVPWLNYVLSDWVRGVYGEYVQNNLAQSQSWGAVESSRLGVAWTQSAITYKEIRTLTLIQ